MREEPLGDDHPAHGDLDAQVALLEEQAVALGRTGRRLERALARYHRALSHGGSDDEIDECLAEVADRLHRLVIQRECAGARSANLSAIAAAYGVPERALRRI